MTDLRDRIFAAEDNNSSLITIPEWDDVELKVTSMSAGQRAQIFEAMQANEGNMPLELFWRVSLISCVLDPETNEQVFDEADAERLLATKSADVIQRISEECLAVSGMAAKAVDDAGKGSSGSEK